MDSMLYAHLVAHVDSVVLFFFFNDTATTEIYTLSLHDALPISGLCEGDAAVIAERAGGGVRDHRSEEHTSELQSQFHLVCRLLLEKKKEDKLYALVALLYRESGRGKPT